MNWIEVNGTSLRYELTGSGPKTLVLIHEMGGTLDSWDQGLGALNNDRRVLRYDTRGAGLSEKIGGVVTWNNMADDLKALLDVFGITGKVAVAGIAVGAAIGMHFAVRNPGPHRRAGHARTRARGFGRPAESRRWNGPRRLRPAACEVSSRPVLRTPIRPWFATTRRCFENFRARWLANDPQSFAAINRMLAAEDISPDLLQIGCPTLVTAGRHDGLRPPSIIEPMARQIPRRGISGIEHGSFCLGPNPGHHVAGDPLLPARFGAVAPFRKGRFGGG